MANTKGHKKRRHKPKPLPTRKVVTPARKPVYAPTIAPHLSGDQMRDQADVETGWAQDLAGLGENLLTTTAGLPQALDQIAKLGRQSRESANANAIERGIFAGSIRDTAIADSEAQQASQTVNATGLVEAARRAYHLRQGQIATDRTRYGAARNQQATDNAREETAALPNGGVIDAGEDASVATDYAIGTPGVQTRTEALKIRARRQNNSRPGSGRGSQRPQPNRPGKPRRLGTKADVRKRVRLGTKARG